MRFNSRLYRPGYLYAIQEKNDAAKNCCRLEQNV